MTVRISSFIPTIDQRDHKSGFVAGDKIAKTTPFLHALVTLHVMASDQHVIPFSGSHDDARISLLIRYESTSSLKIPGSDEQIAEKTNNVSSRVQSVECNSWEYAPLFG